jgi:hypothetical protein
MKIGQPKAITPKRQRITLLLPEDLAETPPRQVAIPASVPPTLQSVLLEILTRLANDDCDRLAPPTDP